MHTWDSGSMDALPGLLDNRVDGAGRVLSASLAVEVFPRETLKLLGVVNEDGVPALATALEDSVRVLGLCAQLLVFAAFGNRQRC